MCINQNFFVTNYYKFVSKMLFGTLQTEKFFQMFAVMGFILYIAAVFSR